MKSVTKSIVLAASALLLAQFAWADETYNCTVQLCLSHPQGYETIQQCIQPVNALPAKLDSGERPVCLGAASQASLAYDRETTLSSCPDGMTEVSGTERVLELPQDAYLQATSNKESGETVGTALLGAVSYEVRNPEGANSIYGHMKDKLCTGNFLGKLNVFYTGGLGGSNLDEDGKNYAIADVYDRVVGIDAKDNGWRVTSYINGSLARVTRLLGGINDAASQ